MTEPELAVLGAAGGGFAWILRWAVGLWAEIRREDIKATKESRAEELASAKESRAATREDGAKMVAALLHQAKSNEQVAAAQQHSTAVLSGKIDNLCVKLDTLVEWRERTPVEMAIPSEESKPRRQLRGYRSPKPGEREDE